MSELNDDSGIWVNVIHISVNKLNPLNAWKPDFVGTAIKPLINLKGYMSKLSEGYHKGFKTPKRP